MEVIIGIVSLIIAVVGVYLAYLQVRQSSKNPGGRTHPSETGTRAGRSSIRDHTPGGDLPASMESLVKELIDQRLLPKYNFEGLAAYTNDDEAGLALVSALIEKKASESIRVIGRGPQVVDHHIEDYLRSIARAIHRGVQYRRILLIDPNLPQNALLWLLFLERFLWSFEHRGLILLHTMKIPMASDMFPQLQIIDGLYLHRVNRHYAGLEAGASRIAQSFFAVHPHPELSQQASIYQSYLENAGTRYNHLMVAELLREILFGLDADGNIQSHGKMATNIANFLDSIHEFPPRGIRFIGSLPPFTYTYDACSKFIQFNESVPEARTQKTQIIPLVFGSLESALESFIEGKLDYLCIPIENSALGDVTPPTIKPSQLAELSRKYRTVYSPELRVKFVLAGMRTKPSTWRHIVAVEATYIQVKEHLQKQAQKLPRHEDEAKSNYHAALRAQSDPSLVAVTNPQAASHLNLHVYQEFDGYLGERTTKFAIFSRE